MEAPRYVSSRRREKRSGLVIKKLIFNVSSISLIFIFAVGNTVDSAKKNLFCSFIMTRGH